MSLFTQNSDNLYSNTTAHQDLQLASHLIYFFIDCYKKKLEIIPRSRQGFIRIVPLLLFLLFITTTVLIAIRIERDRTGELRQFASGGAYPTNAPGTSPIVSPGTTPKVTPGVSPGTTPLKEEPKGGYTLDMILNPDPNTPTGRTGYNCSKGGCPKDVDVSGFYKAPNGRYYPVSGGPSSKDLAYVYKKVDEKINQYATLKEKLATCTGALCASIQTQMSQLKNDLGYTTAKLDDLIKPAPVDEKKNKALEQYQTLVSQYQSCAGQSGGASSQTCIQFLLTAQQFATANGLTSTERAAIDHAVRVNSLINSYVEAGLKLSECQAAKLTSCSQYTVTMNALLKNTTLTADEIALAKNSLAQNVKITSLLNNGVTSGLSPSQIIANLVNQTDLTSVEAQKMVSQATLSMATNVLDALKKTAPGGEVALYTQLFPKEKSSACAKDITCVQKKLQEYIHINAPTLDTQYKSTISQLNLSRQLAQASTDTSGYAAAQLLAQLKVQYKDQLSKATSLDQAIAILDKTLPTRLQTSAVSASDIEATVRQATGQSAPKTTLQNAYETYKSQHTSPGDRLTPEKEQALQKAFESEQLAALDRIKGDLDNDFNKTYAAFLKGEVVPTQLEDKIHPPVVTTGSKGTGATAPTTTRVGYTWLNKAINSVESSLDKVFGLSTNEAKSEAEGAIALYGLKVTPDSQKQLEVFYKNKGVLEAAGYFRADEESEAALIKQIAQGSVKTETLVDDLGTFGKIRNGTWSMVNNLSNGFINQRINQAATNKQEQLTAQIYVQNTVLADKEYVSVIEEKIKTDDTTKKAYETYQKTAPAEKKNLEGFLVNQYQAALDIQDKATAKIYDAPAVQSLFGGSGEESAWLRKAALEGTIDVQDLSKQLSVATKEYDKVDNDQTNKTFSRRGGLTQAQQEKKDASLSQASYVQAELLADAYIKSIPEENRKSIQKTLETGLKNNNISISAQTYQKEQLATYLNDEEVQFLMGSGGVDITMQGVLDGTYDIKRASQTLSALKASDPLVSTALSWNKFENGALLQGQQIMDDPKSNFGDKFRAGVMMSAKPALTAVAIVLPPLRLVQLAGTALTAQTALAIAGDAMGVYMTGSSLQDTATVCTFRGMDTTACLKSAGMTLFAASSAISSASQLNTLARTARATRIGEGITTGVDAVDIAVTAGTWGKNTPILSSISKGTSNLSRFLSPADAAVADLAVMSRQAGTLSLDSLVATLPKAEQAAYNLAAMSQAEKVALSNELLTTSQSRIVQNLATVYSGVAEPLGWQYARNALGTAVFGSMAIDSCSQAVDLNCLTSAGLALVSLGRLANAKTLVEAPQSLTAKAINKADQLVNFAQAGVACGAQALGQVDGSEACMTNIMFAGLSAGQAAIRDGQGAAPAVEDAFQMRTQALADAAVLGNEFYSGQDVVINGETVRVTGDNRATLLADVQNRITQATIGMAQIIGQTNAVAIANTKDNEKKKVEDLSVAERRLANAVSSWRDLVNADGTIKEFIVIDGPADIDGNPPRIPVTDKMVEGAHNNVTAMQQQVAIETQLKANPERTPVEQLGDRITELFGGQVEGMADFEAARLAFENAAKASDYHPLEYKIAAENLEKAKTAMERASFTASQQADAAKIDAETEALAQIEDEAALVKLKIKLLQEPDRIDETLISQADAVQDASRQLVIAMAENSDEAVLTAARKQVSRAQEVYDTIRDVRDVNSTITGEGKRATVIAAENDLKLGPLVKRELASNAKIAALEQSIEAGSTLRGRIGLVVTGVFDLKPASAENASARELRSVKEAISRQMGIDVSEESVALYREFSKADTELNRVFKAVSLLDRLQNRYDPSGTGLEGPLAESRARRMAQIEEVSKGYFQEILPDGNTRTIEEIRADISGKLPSKRSLFSTRTNEEVMSAFDDLIREHQQLIGATADRDAVLARHEASMTRLNTALEKLYGAESTDFLNASIEVRKALKQIDLATQIAKAEASGDTSLVLRLKQSSEVNLASFDSLDTTTRLKLENIIRDTEYRLTIYEQDFRSLRSKQLETIFGLLSNDGTAIELTTSGGKTWVVSAISRIHNEVFDRTAVIMFRKGQAGQLTEYVKSVYTGADDVVRVTSDMFQGDERMTSEALKRIENAKVLVVEPEDLPFLRNMATMKYDNPKVRADVIHAYLSSVSNAGFSIDELNLALDTNSRMINPANGADSAPVEEAILGVNEDVGRVLLDMEMLQDGKFDAWRTSENGKPALTEGYQVTKTNPDGSVTQQVIKHAKFTDAALERLLPALERQFGLDDGVLRRVSEIRDTVRGDEAYTKALADAGIAPEVAAQAVEVLGAVNRYANAMTSIPRTSYFRGVNAYGQRVTIPGSEGVASAQQTYNKYLQPVYEIVGGLAHGEGFVPIRGSGLSVAPELAYQSTVADVIADAVILSGNVHIGGVTGTIGSAYDVLANAYRMVTNVDGETARRIFDEGRLTQARFTVSRPEDIIRVLTEQIRQGVYDTSIGQRSRGNLKITLGGDLGLSSLDVAREIVRQTGDTNKTYVVGMNGDTFYEVRFNSDGTIADGYADANGNPEKIVTTDEVSRWYMNEGREDIVSILDRGSATGGNIRTPEYVPGALLTSDTAPEYLILQAASRLDRTGGLADQHLLLAKADAQVYVDGVSLDALQGTPDQFTEFRKNAIAVQDAYAKEQSAQANTLGMELAARRPLSHGVMMFGTIDSPVARDVADWLSDTLLKMSNHDEVSDTSLKQKNAAEITADTQQKTLAARNERFTQLAKFYEQLFDAPENQPYLKVIKETAPEIYNRMLNSRNALLDVPDGANALAYASLQGGTSKDAPLLQGDLLAYKNSHNVSVTQESEAFFTGGTVDEQKIAQARSQVETIQSEQIAQQVLSSQGKNAAAIGERNATSTRQLSTRDRATLSLATNAIAFFERRLQQAEQSITLNQSQRAQRIAAKNNNAIAIKDVVVGLFKPVQLAPCAVMQPSRFRVFAAAPCTPVGAAPIQVHRVAANITNGLKVSYTDAAGSHDVVLDSASLASIPLNTTTSMVMHYEEGDLTLTADDIQAIQAGTNTKAIGIETYLSASQSIQTTAQQLSTWGISTTAITSMTQAIRHDAEARIRRSAGGATLDAAALSHAVDALLLYEQDAYRNLVTMTNGDRQNINVDLLEKRLSNSRATAVTALQAALPKSSIEEASALLSDATRKPLADLISIQKKEVQTMQAKLAAQKRNAAWFAWWIGLPNRVRTTFTQQTYFGTIVAWVRNIFGGSSQTKKITIAKTPMEAALLGVKEGKYTDAYTMYSTALRRSKTNDAAVTDLLPLEQALRADIARRLTGSFGVTVASDHPLVTAQLAYEAAFLGASATWNGDLTVQNTAALFARDIDENPSVSPLRQGVIREIQAFRSAESSLQNVNVSDEIYVTSTILPLVRSTYAIVQIDNKIVAMPQRTTTGNSTGGTGGGTGGAGRGTSGTTSSPASQISAPTQIVLRALKSPLATRVSAAQTIIAAGGYNATYEALLEVESLHLAAEIAEIQAILATDIRDRIGAATGQAVKRPAGDAMVKAWIQKDKVERAAQIFQETQGARAQAPTRAPQVIAGALAVVAIFGAAGAMGAQLVSQNMAPRPPPEPVAMTAPAPVTTNTIADSPYEAVAQALEDINAPAYVYTSASQPEQIAPVSNQTTTVRVESTDMSRFHTSTDRPINVVVEQELGRSYEDGTLVCGPLSAQQMADAGQLNLDGQPKSGVRSIDGNPEKSVVQKFTQLNVDEDEWFLHEVLPDPKLGDTVGSNGRTNTWHRLNTGESLLAYLEQHPMPAGTFVYMRGGDQIAHMFRISINSEGRMVSTMNIQHDNGEWAIETVDVLENLRASQASSGTLFRPSGNFGALIIAPDQEVPMKDAAVQVAAVNEDAGSVQPVVNQNEGTLQPVAFVNNQQIQRSSENVPFSALRDVNDPGVQRQAIVYSVLQDFVDLQKTEEGRAQIQQLISSQSRSRSYVATFAEPGAAFDPKNTQTFRFWFEARFATDLQSTGLDFVNDPALVGALDAFAGQFGLPRDGAVLLYQCYGLASLMDAMTAPKGEIQLADQKVDTASWVFDKFGLARNQIVAGRTWANTFVTAQVDSLDDIQDGDFVVYDNHIVSILKVYDSPFGPIALIDQANSPKHGTPNGTLDFMVLDEAGFKEEVGDPTQVLVFRRISFGTIAHEEAPQSVLDMLTTPQNQMANTGGAALSLVAGVGGLAGAANGVTGGNGTGPDNTVVVDVPVTTGPAATPAEAMKQIIIAYYKLEDPTVLNRFYSGANADTVLDPVSQEYAVDNLINEVSTLAERLPPADALSQLHRALARGDYMMAYRAYVGLQADAQTNPIVFNTATEAIQRDVAERLSAELHVPIAWDHAAVARIAEYELRVLAVTNLVVQSPSINDYQSYADAVHGDPTVVAALAQAEAVYDTLAGPLGVNRTAYSDGLRSSIDPVMRSAWSEMQLDDVIAARVAAQILVQNNGSTRWQPRPVPNKWVVTAGAVRAFFFPRVADLRGFPAATPNNVSALTSYTLRYAGVALIPGIGPVLAGSIFVFDLAHSLLDQFGAVIVSWPPLQRFLLMDYQWVMNLVENPKYRNSTTQVIFNILAGSHEGWMESYFNTAFLDLGNPNWTPLSAITRGIFLWSTRAPLAIFDFYRTAQAYTERVTGKKSPVLEYGYEKPDFWGGNGKTFGIIPRWIINATPQTNTIVYVLTRFVLPGGQLLIPYDTHRFALGGGLQRLTWQSINPLAWRWWNIPKRVATPSAGTPTPLGGTPNRGAAPSTSGSTVSPQSAQPTQNQTRFTPIRQFASRVFTATPRTDRAIYWVSRVLFLIPGPFWGTRALIVLGFDASRLAATLLSRSPVLFAGVQGFIAKTGGIFSFLNVSPASGFGGAVWYVVSRAVVLPMIVAGLGLVFGAMGILGIVPAFIVTLFVPLIIGYDTLRIGMWAHHLSPTVSRTNIPSQQATPVQPQTVPVAQTAPVAPQPASPVVDLTGYTLAGITLPAGVTPASGVDITARYTNATGTVEVHGTIRGRAGLSAGSWSVAIDGINNPIVVPETQFSAEPTDPLARTEQIINEHVFSSGVRMVKESSTDWSFRTPLLQSSITDADVQVWGNEHAITVDFNNTSLIQNIRQEILSERIGGFGITNRSMQEIRTQVYADIDTLLESQTGKVVVLGSGFSELSIELAKRHERGQLAQKPVLVDLFDYRRLLADLIAIKAQLDQENLPAPFENQLRVVQEVVQAIDDGHLDATIYFVGTDTQPTVATQADLVINIYGPPESTIPEQLTLLAPSGQLLYVDGAGVRLEGGDRDAAVAQRLRQMYEEDKALQEQQRALDDRLRLREAARLATNISTIRSVFAEIASDITSPMAFGDRMVELRGDVEVIGEIIGETPRQVFDAFTQESTQAQTDALLARVREQEQQLLQQRAQEESQQTAEFLARNATAQAADWTGKYLLPGVVEAATTAVVPSFEAWQDARELSRRLMLVRALQNQQASLRIMSDSQASAMNRLEDISVVILGDAELRRLVVSGEERAALEPRIEAILTAQGITNTDFLLAGIDRTRWINEMTTMMMELFIDERTQAQLAQQPTTPEASSHASESDFIQAYVKIYGQQYSAEELVELKAQLHELYVLHNNAAQVTYVRDRLRGEGPLNVIVNKVLLPAISSGFERSIFDFGDDMVIKIGRPGEQMINELLLLTSDPEALKRSPLISWGRTTNGYLYFVEEKAQVINPTSKEWGPATFQIAIDEYRALRSRGLSVENTRLRQDWQVLTDQEVEQLQALVDLQNKYKIPDFPFGSQGSSNIGKSPTKGFVLLDMGVYRTRDASKQWIDLQANFVSFIKNNTILDKEDEPKSEVSPVTEVNPKTAPEKIAIDEVTIGVPQQALADNPIHVLWLAPHAINEDAATLTQANRYVQRILGSPTVNPDDVAALDNYIEAEFRQYYVDNTMRLTYPDTALGRYLTALRDLLRANTRINDSDMASLSLAFSKLIVPVIREQLLSVARDAQDGNPVLEMDQTAFLMQIQASIDEVATTYVKSHLKKGLFSLGGRNYSDFENPWRNLPQSQQQLFIEPVTESVEVQPIGESQSQTESVPEDNRPQQAPNAIEYLNESIRDIYTGIVSLVTSYIFTSFGEDYFQAFRPLQISTFINTMTTRFGALGPQIDWTFLFWRLSDLGAGMLSMSLVSMFVDLAYRLITKSHQKISPILLAVSSLLSAYLYQLYDIAHQLDLPLFNSAVMHILHPSIFWSNLVQNISQDPYDAVAMAVGIAIVFVSRLGYAGLATKGWSLANTWIGKYWKRAVIPLFIGFIALFGFTQRTNAPVSNLVQDTSQNIQSQTFNAADHIGEENQILMGVDESGMMQLGNDMVDHQIEIFFDGETQHWVIRNAPNESGVTIQDPQFFRDGATLRNTDAYRLYDGTTITFGTSGFTAHAAIDPVTNALTITVDPGSIAPQVDQQPIQPLGGSGGGLPPGSYRAEDHINEAHAVMFGVDQDGSTQIDPVNADVVHGTYAYIYFVEEGNPLQRRWMIRNASGDSPVRIQDSNHPEESELNGITGYELRDGVLIWLDSGVTARVAIDPQTQVLTLTPSRSLYLLSSFTPQEVLSLVHQYFAIDIETIESLVQREHIDMERAQPDLLLIIILRSLAEQHLVSYAQSKDFMQYFVLSHQMFEDARVFLTGQDRVRFVEELMHCLDIILLSQGDDKKLIVMELIRAIVDLQNTKSNRDYIRLRIQQSNFSNKTQKIILSLLESERPSELVDSLPDGPAKTRLLASFSEDELREALMKLSDTELFVTDTMYRNHSHITWVGAVGLQWEKLGDVIDDFVGRVVPEKLRRFIPEKLYYLKNIATFIPLQIHFVPFFAHQNSEYDAQAMSLGLVDLARAIERIQSIPWLFRPKKVWGMTNPTMALFAIRTLHFQLDESLEVTTPEGVKTGLEALVYIEANQNRVKASEKTIHISAKTSDVVKLMKSDTMVRLLARARRNERVNRLTSMLVRTVGVDPEALKNTSRVAIDEPAVIINPIVETQPQEVVQSISVWQQLGDWWGNRSTSIFNGAVNFYERTILGVTPEPVPACIP